MRKLLITITCLISVTVPTHANHITGGEIYYTYLGLTAGNYQYHITLKLFRDCYSNGAPLNEHAMVSIFDKRTDTKVWDGTSTRTMTVIQSILHPNPCITNPPFVCYEIAYYEYDVSLPSSPEGYIIAHQNCCRLLGITNLLHTITSTSYTGAIYTAEIPGTRQLTSAPVNNSARFTGADTIVVCSGNYFTYSSPATDADGDSLTYFFAGAYSGSPNIDGHGAPPDVGQGVYPADAPPFGDVGYARGFSGIRPMGPGVKINTKSGLVSGIAPALGIYVITVCVNEIRNGKLIATQRKDIQVKVSDCEIARASLLPEYVNCDSLIMHFQNFSNSPLIRSFDWDFGVTGSSTDTSTLGQPVFNYPDTGSYIIKLVTNRNQFCADSVTSIVKIYPGFTPGFVASGSCVNKPIRFIDTSHAAYGIVNSWEWDFGDDYSVADFSQLQNPVWTYSQLSSPNVQFIVTTSKGCSGTVEKTIPILLKPLITMAFRDTLICTPDVIRLVAGGGGVFSWTPQVNIVNPNTSTPVVNPIHTTVYYVDLDETGCHNRDSVKIRVVDHVTLVAHSDTTICRTDSVLLGAYTDGLRFLWTPATTLNDPSLLNPIATPLNVSTTYQLVARIGSCMATDNLMVTTVPYPVANAGTGGQICYNTSTQLHGSYAGNSFSWSPASYVSDPHNLNPIVRPPRTTSFLLTVYDTLGCPKPGRDTVVVNVFPKVNVVAGNDTSVVAGQPLHFNAGGGVHYQWSPAIGLNDVTIHDPIGIYGPQMDDIRYKVVVTDVNGCLDSSFVKVTVFKTNPYVFVPTGFTPNNDGLNDVVRPIPVGVQQINDFRIYDRWGQLMFSNVNGQGWDGTLKGKPQGSAVFLWMVKATDYTGKPIFLKGTVALIR